MNKNLTQLYNIASKSSRLIIGLMSGTSLDGLDIALCRITGKGIDTKLELLQFETHSYDESFKMEVRSIFSRKIVNLEKLCLLNNWIGKEHAAMILLCLHKWKILAEEIDLIASHGQTVYHAPKLLHQQKKFGNATLQIGDGDQIAVTTGIITISDFRQKHIAAGGEGAPLAVYGDYFMFNKEGENRIMLNIGGIANFTYLPGNRDVAGIFSTDTGPGNTLMDAYIQQQFSRPFDKNAEMALQGVVDNRLLETLLKHPFFEKGFPKTTGPELFNLPYLESAIERTNLPQLSPYNIMATLNQFSAVSISEAIKKSLDHKKKYILYSSGGGMHNPLLMKNLQLLLSNCIFQSTTDLQINPDAKEAILFAILANECVVGGDTNLGTGNHDIPNVSMGKISFPW